MPAFAKTEGVRIVALISSTPAKLTEFGERYGIPAGAPWDIGIYGVNAARYLAGEDLVEVTDFGNRLPNDPRFETVDDLTQMVLRFPGGALASISMGHS